MSKRRKEHDPLERYRDWMANRYNPGAYLGGDIDPVNRAYQDALSVREKQVAGAALLFVLCLAYLVLPASTFWNGAPYAMVVVLFIVVAVARRRKRMAGGQKTRELFVPTFAMMVGAFVGCVAYARGAAVIAASSVLGTAILVAWLAHLDRRS